MKVGLKRAHELQLQAIAAARDVSLSPVVALSTYTKEDPERYVERMFAAASGKIDAGVELSLALLQAAYEIRRLCGNVHAAMPAQGQSHNELLTARAHVDALEKRLLEIKDALERDAYGTSKQDEAVARIEDAQAVRANPDRKHNVSIDRDLLLHVVTEQQAEGLKLRLAQVRQQKAALKAQLDRNNLLGEITLPDATERTLRQARIIVDPA